MQFEVGAAYGFSYWAVLLLKVCAVVQAFVKPCALYQLDVWRPGFQPRERPED